MVSMKTERSQLSRNTVNVELSTLIPSLVHVPPTTMVLHPGAHSTCTHAQASSTRRLAMCIHVEPWTPTLLLLGHSTAVTR